jgi:hypothetical protein
MNISVMKKAQQTQPMQIDDWSADELSSELLPQSHKCTQQFKKTSRSHPTEGEPVAKKRRIDKALVAEPNPVVEILRDEAFFVGLLERNRSYEQLEKELGIEEDVEIKNPFDVVPLRRNDDKIIADIQEKKGLQISQQLFELYQMLAKSHKLTKNAGKEIIDFAFTIIDQVKDACIDDEEPLEIEYRQMAQEFLDAQGIDFTAEQACQLGRQLQNAMQAASEDIPPEDNESIIAIERLGILLLVCQHDQAMAAECASITSFDEALETLDQCAEEIIQVSVAALKEHAEAHLKTAIQSHEEALFQRMAIEMANLLLLNTGSINIGLVDRVSEQLIPKEFEQLVATETLRQVLALLVSSSLYAREIASVSAPESHTGPSALSIRCLLGLGHDEPITKRHAQIFVLSAVLGHFRQANAGTCFATACLIRARLYHLQFFIQDLKQLTAEGRITRSLHGELRHFPYFARVTKEYLDTLVECDSDGFICGAKRYKLKPYQQKSWPQPVNAYLSQAPGIVAVCAVLGIANSDEAIRLAIANLPKPFSINELLQNLVTHAWQEQESIGFRLRSRSYFSKEQFLERAQFAFGSQTNHPLHAAYEQSAAAMVSYFGSQYAIPSWIHETLSGVIEKSAKCLTSGLQKKFKALQAEIFLPLIIRMRFRYNPHIDDAFKLFDDGNYGATGETFYGYELCDGGLPKDFTYSRKLYNEYRQGSSMITLQRFNHYLPEQQWQVINSGEKFQHFVHSVVKDTVAYLKTNEPKALQGQWDEAASAMIKAINSPTFARQMIFLLLGKQSNQKKHWTQNPHQLQTTPWTFRWGGDFNAVMQTYFGFSAPPSKMKEFIGSPREVLAKCINYIKNQPQQIKQELSETDTLMLVTSPVHAFLLKPDEPSFINAWKNEENTNAFIASQVELPGKKIAHGRLSIRACKELIDFIANNQWCCRADEKSDFLRQKLTDHSKGVFDTLIGSAESLFELSRVEFEKELSSIVAEARAADPRIGARNGPWEKLCTRAIRTLSKRLMADSDTNGKISKKNAQALIDFARNREDSVSLSQKAIIAFLKRVQSISYASSVKEFRTALLNAAYDAHKLDTNIDDHGWKILLAEELDSYLFTLLPEIQRQQLLQSAIITHDPNWKAGVHDYRFAFMVNPGSGEIELCCYLPDLKKISFMDQTDWFPKGKHAYWEFPDNYRAYASQPLFNVKKYIG